MIVIMFIWLKSKYICLIKNCNEQKTKILRTDLVQTRFTCRTFCFSCGFAFVFGNRFSFWCAIISVSYTHLDVYKRQIMNFMDASDFDVRAVKKSCVHIVDKRYKLVPFETMNLFYRDNKIEEIREKLNRCLLYTSRCV